MESADIKNIVSRVVNSAPNGGTLNEAEVLEWQKNPFVWELVKAVEPSDIPDLFSLMENANWPVANLAVRLLRNFENNAEVLRHYLDIWNNANRPMELRYCVMFPLLDNPELPRELHEKFFNTILANIDSFKRFVITYFTQNDLIKIIEERMRNPKYPPAKRWIRLCSVLASPDEPNARKLIESFKDDPDPFVAKVARTLLEKVLNKT
jgi:hypothetical protein